MVKGSANVVAVEPSAVRNGDPPASGIPPPAAVSMLATLAHSHVYIDAFSTIVTIVRQSIASGVIAFAANLLLTQGAFWINTSPKKQSFQAFASATMGYVALFIGVANLLGFSAPLAKYKWIRHPQTRLPGLFWAVRLLAASLRQFLLSITLVAAIAYASASLDATWQPYQIHFYAGGLLINFYTATLDVSARWLYQTQTVEGIALGYVNRTKFWRRVLRAYRKDCRQEPPSRSRVELVALQLLIEILVDFLCCLWELVNGIPLRATSGMDSFLVVVFSGCAVTNVAVCCAFYMRASPI